jgi:hypothetical protein
MKYTVTSFSLSAIGRSTLAADILETALNYNLPRGHEIVAIITHPQKSDHVLVITKPNEHEN